MSQKEYKIRLEDCSMTQSQHIEYNYNIHGILKVNSNFKGILPDCFLTNKELENPDIILRLVKKVEVSSDRRIIQIAPGLFYDEGNDLVVSLFNLGGFNMGWTLKGLLKERTEVFVSSAYRRFVQMPVSTVHPLNDYIKFILQIRLILKGYSFLLGGSFRPKNSDYAAVISSSGGMGKTTTILNLIKKTGAEFLSDDTSIISKDKVYSYPSPLRKRVFGSLILGYCRNIPVEKILLPNVIRKDSLNARFIFFLERSRKNEILLIDSISALNKIISINRKIIPYSTERSILGYFYKENQYNINNLIKKEEDILKSFLGNLKCYLIRAAHLYSYIDLITEVIK
ncbi:MAG: hypothetical protein NC936_00305 [Candidatus Omnitrophica bacterium]|nr:hypothetical protein [Candidatus Omnitrophota bacterium]